FSLALMARQQSLNAYTAKLAWGTATDFNSYVLGWAAADNFNMFNEKFVIVNWNDVEMVRNFLRS
ncbi:TPA: hypothetical protein ACISXX_004953, partial [Salmonella enterica subsp. diarizonae serovar 61:l,v:z35]